jgi:hypothetical protein
MPSSDSNDVKQSELVIAQFHRCLNTPENVPARAYRRNSSTYPLVCYINNLVGALLSENYEVVSLFVARAAEHMVQVPCSAESAGYYALASSYLAQVVHHVRCLGTGAEFDAERIPEAILSAGPQPAPNPSIERTPSSGLRPLTGAAHVER